MTFDTMKYAEALKTAGVPEAQAKSQADALAHALQTDPDLTEMTTEITKLRNDIVWIKWIVTVGVCFYIAHWIGDWYVIVNSIHL